MANIKWNTEKVKFIGLQFLYNAELMPLVWLMIDLEYLFMKCRPCCCAVAISVQGINEKNRLMRNVKRKIVRKRKRWT